MSFNPVAGVIKGKKKARPKQNRRAEHEGRVAQPGVPKGPRQTVKVPRKKKVRASGSAKTGSGGSGFNPADILGVISTSSDPTGITDPGSGARHLVEEEAKNLAEVTRRHYPTVLGGKADSATFRQPLDKKSRDAALTLLSAPTGEGAAAKATTAASDLPTAAKEARALLAKGGERLKSAPARKVARAKSAPKRAVARVKETPKRVKSAPKRAKKAVSSKEGRRAVAKSGAKKAAKHPVRTGYAGAVALPPGVLPEDATKRARAAAEGTIDAIIHHPAETAKTTLRALPAAITGPVALGAAAVDSAIHGTPTPLENTAKEQAKGVGQIVGNTFSGDPKKAEEAARKEGSLSLLTPIPALSKTKTFKAARIRSAERLLRPATERTAKCATPPRVLVGSMCPASPPVTRTANGCPSSRPERIIPTGLPPPSTSRTFSTRWRTPPPVPMLPFRPLLSTAFGTNGARTLCGGTAPSRRTAPGATRPCTRRSTTPSCTPRFGRTPRSSRRSRILKRRTPGPQRLSRARASGRGFFRRETRWGLRALST
jgi:hypothetical protein